MAMVVSSERVHLAPFLYEKHVSHQDGVAGTLSIRLVEAKNLRAGASMFWLRTCNPYVIFRVGKQSARSATIQANDNPSWRRELMEIKLPKLDFKRVPLEEHSNVRLELIVDVMNEDSYTGSVTECVGITNGSVIGTATLDFTSLLEGRDHVIDRWLTLSGALPQGDAHAATKATSPSVEKKRSATSEEDLVLGEVRVIVQYEPFGIEPKSGDIVKLEGFGAYPSALLSPIDELELHVKKVNGNFLLCSYLTKSGFEGTLRIHRNNVFVVHRGSLMDRLYDSCVTGPVEYVSNTPLGQSCIEYAKPYVKGARAFSIPALIAAKTIFTTSLHASKAAIQAYVDSMD